MGEWNGNDAGSGEVEAALREAPSGNAITNTMFRDPALLKAVQDKGWGAQQPAVYLQKESAVAESSEAPAEVDTGGAAMPTWMHSAVKYEWKDDYGDTGDREPELEEILFAKSDRVSQGQRIGDLTKIKVIVEAEATNKPEPIRSFRDGGLHPAMLENCLMSGYEIPLPIQAYTIPSVLKGHDVVGIAQTGSGKTAAYMVPVLSKLMGKVKKLGGPRSWITQGPVRAEPLVLIVAPTRELCLQIFDEARRLCYRSMLRPCVAYGGGPIRGQRDDLRKGCDVLIATPGRLLDFMKDPNLLAMSRVRFTIIDEADEMLHEDWREELHGILRGADINQDGQHQYLLFSATFDKRMRKLAKQYLAQDYIRIRIGRTGSTVPNIRQQIVWVENNLKKEALYDLLMASPPARTLIFVRSKKSVDYVDDFLFNRHLPTTSIHSERTQLEREDSMRGFRSGKSPILIATGVSSRGLDIKNVMHVINYDLPLAEYAGQDEYIHRIGRTGRLGNIGLATSFYNEGDEPMAAFLAKILVENKQEVPEFLEEFKPADTDSLDFDDNSDDEPEPSIFGVSEAHGGEDGAWGGNDAGTGAPAADIPAADAWGTGGTNGAAGGKVTDDAW